MSTITCLVCGKEKTKGRWTLYCSPVCRQEQYSNCGTCGGKTTSSAAKTCAQCLGSRRREKETAWLVIEKKVDQLKSTSRKAHRLVNKALKKVIASHVDDREAIEFNGMQLPYTPLDLYTHLNNCFIDIPEYDMTWENYGLYWCIDHIVPQSAFGYDSFEDKSFDLCWSLDNLQPLPLTINSKKGAKVFRHNMPACRTREQAEMNIKRVDFIVDDLWPSPLLLQHLSEDLKKEYAKHFNNSPYGLNGIPKRFFEPWSKRN